METIRKTICVESYRSRTNGEFPTIDLSSDFDTYQSLEGSDYGHFPYDLRLVDDSDTELLSYVSKLYEIRDSLPCIGGDVLTYKTMIHLYSTMKKVIYDTKYYKICMKDGEYVWREVNDDEWATRLGFENTELPYEVRKFFGRGIMFLDTLPNLYIYSYAYDNGENVYSSIKYFDTLYRYTRYYNKDTSDVVYDIDEPYEGLFYYEYNGVKTENFNDISEDCEVAIDTIKKYYKDECEVIEVDEDKIKTHTFSDAHDESLIIGVSNKMGSVMGIFRNEFKYDIITEYGSDMYGNIDDYLNNDNIYMSYIMDEYNGFKDVPVYIYPYEYGTRYEYFFYLMMEYMFKHKKDEIEYGMTNAEPCIRIPVYISSDMTDIGLYTTVAEEWVPGKRYYDGEYVMYGNKYYRLSLPDGEMYYKGYFNKQRRIIEFNPPTQTYWKEAEYGDNDIVTDKMVVANSYSRLNDFLKYRKTYDINGDMLPFYLNDNSIVELPYMVGVPRNMTIDDGKFFCDILKTVEFTDADSQNIAFEGVVKANDVPYNYGVATFTYFIGCEVDPDSGEIIDKTGTKYVDTYDFSKDKFYCVTDSTNPFPIAIYDLGLGDGGETFRITDKGDIDKSAVGKKYLYVGKDEDGLVSGHTYETRYEVEYINLHINRNADGYVISEMSFNESELVKDRYQEIPYFKDDSLMKVHDINRNIDVRIDRGSSAAFERHNILGEVNTLEDLENYRNGFFDIYGF